MAVSGINLEKSVEKVGCKVLTGEGIRYELDVFRREDGSSRIMALWDQTIQDGEPPQGFLYGTEYTRADINRALQTDEPRVLVPSTDVNGHGTQMASVAAGSVLNQGLTFRGAAPQADIAVVKLKGAKQYLRDYYLIADNAEVYQENDIMEAVKYLEHMAIALSRPVVIVLGIGTNLGSHNGTSPLASYLNNVAGRRSRAIVICGGNEGDKEHHYENTVPDNVEIRVAEEMKGFCLELWGTLPDIYAIRVRSPGGETSQEIDFRSREDRTIDFIFERTHIVVSTRGAGSFLQDFSFILTKQGFSCYDDLQNKGVLAEDRTALFWNTKQRLSVRISGKTPGSEGGQKCFAGQGMMRAGAELEWRFPMKNYTREDIVRLVEEEDVEFIRLQFTDMLGHLKNIAITANQLDKALDNQCMFDGSAIDGFVGIEESDMYLHPDLATLEIFPWRPQQGKVARMICDIYRPDGTPFDGDPRRVLKNAIRDAQEMGYTFEVGPECEFFLFDTDENAMPTTKTHEQAGYFDIGPLDGGENARRDIVMTLEEMGLILEASHHEAAPAQHEIDFRYDEALAAADNLMTFKLAVRTIAKRHGLHATFMPKPKYGVNGSGMHINMSLHRNGKNIFEDPDDVNGLSREAYYFVGGIMKHIKGMAAVTNQLVNSYKRLVPGYAAPVYIAWSTTNRSPLIRIPANRGGNTRIELRSPDSAANPYLTLAVCLKAGLDGIVNRIDPPESVDCNIYTMSDAQRKALKIETLPGTLIDAVAELKKDTFILDVLGKHVADKYIAAKEREWQQYREQVTAWEIQEYLYRY